MLASDRRRVRLVHLRLCHREIVGVDGYELYVRSSDYSFRMNFKRKSKGGFDRATHCVMTIMFA